RGSTPALLVAATAGRRLPRRAGAENQTRRTRGAVPQRVGREHAAGLGDDVAASAEVDLVLGEGGGRDVEAQPSSGLHPLRRAPHRHLDLIDIAANGRQLLVEALSVAQPEHAVAEPLGALAGADQAEPDDHVGVRGGGAYMADQPHWADDVKRLAGWIGGVHEDVASSLYAGAVVGAAALPGGGGGRVRHRVSGI